MMYYSFQNGDWANFGVAAGQTVVFQTHGHFEDMWEYVCHRKDGHLYANQPTK